MQATCKHCDRVIVASDGRWIDPEATGDDAIWRETCDAHDTITAEHEPGEVVFTGVLGERRNEDSGQAAILTLDSEDGLDDGEFVRVQSWRTENTEHPLIDALDGKRVRIVVTVLD